VIDSYRAAVGAQTLVLIRKRNGGKADALNTGVNAARKNLVCMVDADSILDPDALLHVARPFAEDPNRVVASGGVVRVANGSTIQRGRVTQVRMPGTWLGRIQVVEYLRGFLVGRSAWAAAGGLLIISGAFGLFRRDILERMGGLDPDCIGEDAELVVRMHRWMRETGFDGRVVFVPEPVAWTEAPSTLGSLSAQRRRWHRGLTEILTKHRRMIGNPKYGVVGLIALPWFVLFELLAPVLEFVGFLAFLAATATYAGQELGFLPDGLVDGRSVLLLFFASVVYATVTTWAILLAEEVSFRRYHGTRDLVLSMVASVEENFGFRQLTAWWRIRGLWDAVRGSTHRWGNMERRGFDTQ
jgi:cellulose synthase/poly-beta-1,6-N-acetylglucosamine synthase-like glycosyltransferase